jgi:hypothetical protein
MPTILITGGTGLIGRALSKMLREQDYEVILLSHRKQAPAGPGTAIPTAYWDPARQYIDPEPIRIADAIVHLAGAGVADKRWTTQRKNEIVNSRVLSGALLVKALGEAPNKVRTVVGMSAIGWYGADPSIPNPHPFTEDAPADTAFLGETCRLWETAIDPVTSLGKRLVIFRSGVVLSDQGGAMRSFLKPARAGIAAILGSGKQVISWIHIDDMCRLILEAIRNEDWRGVYNAVSPRPVDNRSFTRELASRLKGRFFVPVYIPSFLLKMLVGGMSIEVLKSATVSSEKLRRAGFQFLHPTLAGAFDQLLPRGNED